MLGSTGALFRSCVLACCLLPIMTSCSKDPTPPGTLPSDTALPTTSSSTSPATPSSPKPTSAEEEVEAAVRAYYAELTRAAQTQDTSSLRRHIARDCPCVRVVTAIERLQKRGRTTPEAAWRVTRVKVKERSDETALAKVNYIVDSYTVMNAKGDVVDRYSKQEGHVDLYLVRGPKEWIVGNLFDLEG